MGLALGAAVTLALAAVSAQAGIAFERVTWGSGEDTLGWYSADGFATASSPGSGGNPLGYLLLHFDAPGMPALETDAMAQNGEGYTGDYTGLGLTFDYLGYPSSAQALYFESTVGGGSVWAYAFGSGAHGWETESFSFADAGGWTRLSGSADFFTALRQVSEIGIRVAHLNDGRPFDYGLDNWQWSIPEPGAAWMAGVALLSGGLLLGPRLWRRRRDPPSAE